MYVLRSLRLSGSRSLVFPTNFKIKHWQMNASTFRAIVWNAVDKAISPGSVLKSEIGREIDRGTETEPKAGEEVEEIFIENNESDDNEQIMHAMKHFCSSLYSMQCLSWLQIYFAVCIALRRFCLLQNKLDWTMECISFLLRLSRRRFFSLFFVILFHLHFGWEWSDSKVSARPFYSAFDAVECTRNGVRRCSNDLTNEWTFIIGIIMKFKAVTSWMKWVNFSRLSLAFRRRSLISLKTSLNQSMNASRQSANSARMLKKCSLLEMNKINSLAVRINIGMN